MRKCWVQAFSPFPTMFSKYKYFYARVNNNTSFFGRGFRKHFKIKLQKRSFFLHFKMLLLFIHSHFQHHTISSGKPLSGSFRRACMILSHVTDAILDEAIYLIILTFSSIYIRFNTLKKKDLGKQCGKR